jgi:glycerol kinase
MTEENYYKARDILEDINTIDSWLDDIKKNQAFASDVTNTAFKIFLEDQKEKLEKDFSKL